MTAVPTSKDVLKGASDTNVFRQEIDQLRARVALLEHGLRDASGQFSWLAEHHLTGPFAPRAARELSHKFWDLQFGKRSSVETGEPNYAMDRLWEIYKLATRSRVLPEDIDRIAKLAERFGPIPPCSICKQRHAEPEQDCAQLKRGAVEPFGQYVELLRLYRGTLDEIRGICATDPDNSALGDIDESIEATLRAVEDLNGSSDDAPRELIPIVNDDGKFFGMASPTSRDVQDSTWNGPRYIQSFEKASNEPTPQYTCYVPGCPGTHASKYQLCTIATP